MIPNYQIDILKKEKEKASMLVDKELFNALSNAIRVLEANSCPSQSNRQRHDNSDGFKDGKGESQAEKFGY